MKTRYIRLLLPVAAFLLLALWIRATVSLDSAHCVKPKFLDGRLTDWREPYILLAGWAWHAEEGRTPVYGGTTDCSATLRTAWDAKGLYLAIAVVDDVFRPAKMPPFDGGDCVMLRVESAVARPGEAPAEFVVPWASPVGAYRREASGELVKATGVRIGAARANLPLPATLPPGEAGKTPATGLTKVWYEMMIPWSAIPGASSAIPQALNLEMDVLDDDGDGLRGRLHWHGQPRLLHVVPGMGLVLPTTMKKIPLSPANRSAQ